MTRLTTAAAVGALILSATAAFAATPISYSHSTSAKYSQRCAALESQWKSAIDAHGISRHLGRAKADAARGARHCNSHSMAQRRQGVSDYRAALKLIGVRPI